VAQLGLQATEAGRDVNAQVGNYDIYGDFVLLPDEAPVPPFVDMPTEGLPAMEGLAGNAAQAVSETLADQSELRDTLGFKMYSLPATPTGMRQARPTVIRNERGTIFVALIQYERQSPRFENASGGSRWQGAIAISASPTFPRPVPMWAYGTPPGSQFPDKVTYLPTPGLITNSRSSLTVHWVESSVLYRVTADTLSQTEMRNIVESLVPVN
jgi:hypothetical protein